MTKEQIEHEIVAISDDTSISLGFLSIVCQVTSSVSSFNICLELFSDIHYVFVGPSDVISLLVSDVRHPRKLIYLLVLSLEVLSSELLHFICLDYMMRPVGK